MTQEIMLSSLLADTDSKLFIYHFIPQGHPVFMSVIFMSDAHTKRMLKTNRHTLKKCTYKLDTEY